MTEQKLKYIQERMVCTDDRIKKLKAVGYKTNGYADNLERILTDNEFSLPVANTDDFGTVRYGFRVGKYFSEYLHYADALAEFILLLNREGELL